MEFERGAQRKGSRGRHALAARLEAHDAAERRRNPHRTAGVAADRDLGHAVTDRHRGAGRGAAGNAGAIARIAGCAEMRIGADRAERKLGHVGLGDDHRTAGAKPPHDRSVGCGRLRFVGEDVGTGPGRLAGDVEQILDADDRSVERAERYAVLRPRIGRVRRRPRGFGINRQARFRALPFRIGDAGRILPARRFSRHQFGLAEPQAGDGKAPRRRRARYVDVAVIAPIHPARHKTPLLLAGPHADAVAPVLAALAMRATVAGAEVQGAAAAIKMIRSVIMKGMEALTLECFLAAARAGVVDEVAGSLKNNYPSLDWAKIIPYNLERMASHGERRAAEMEEVAATLRQLGIEPLMTQATVQRQREMGEIGAQQSVRRMLKKDRAAILNAISAAAPGPALNGHCSPARPREGGDPAIRTHPWIPAFAGMSGKN